MFIQTEATDHPESLKFLPGRTVMASGSADFPNAQSAKRGEVARAPWSRAEVFLEIAQSALVVVSVTRGLAISG